MVSDYAALPDSELVPRVQGEVPYVTAGYAVLMRRHQALIRRICAGILVEAADLDDVQQEVMLKVFQKLGSFKQRSAFKTWLTRIVMNQCFTCNRKAQRRVRDVDPGGGDLIDRVAADEQSPAAPDDDFGQLIAGLSSDERSILTLKFVAELEFGEIAGLLDMKLSTAKMRYYRALDKLKAQTEQ